MSIKFESDEMDELYKIINNRIKLRKRSLLYRSEKASAFDSGGSLSDKLTAKLEELEFVAAVMRDRFSISD